MDMLFCTNCGTQLPAVAKFCAQCGTPVAPTVAVVSTPEPIATETFKTEEQLKTEESVAATEILETEEIPAEEAEEIASEESESPAEESCEEVCEANFDAVTETENTEAPIPQEMPPVEQVYTAPVYVPPVYVVPPVVQAVTPKKRKFGAKEGVKIRKKVGFFRRFFALILCFFLFITVLLGMIVMDVRNFTSQDFIEDLLGDFSLSIIPDVQLDKMLDDAGITPLMKDSKLGDLIHDLHTGEGNTVITANDVMDFVIENEDYLYTELGLEVSPADVREALHSMGFDKVSTEDLRDLLDDSPIATLVAAKVTSVVDGILTGEDTSLSRKEVKRMVNNVNDYFEDEFEISLSEDLQDGMTDFFTDGEIFAELTAENIANEAEGILSAIRFGLSLYLIIGFGLFALIWILLIFLCSRRSWTRTAKTIGIVFLIPGLIFTAATAIASLMPSVWLTICGEITVLSVATATFLTANASVSLTVFGSGLVLLVGGMVLSRIFRKIEA